MNLLDLHYRTFGSGFLRPVATSERHSPRVSDYLRPMRYADVIGHEALGAKLRESVRNGRVAHAQLFEGQEGAGSIGIGTGPRPILDV